VHPAIRNVALLLIGLGAVAGAPAPLGNELCSWKSKTAPQELLGELAGSEATEYAFDHLSDVDKQDDGRLFVYVIHNKHPKNLLPAEWRNGKGEIVVSFERIAPLGCAANSVPTTLEHAEDSNGVVRYGPTRQNSKKAPLFVLTGSARPQPADKERQLNSAIVAELLDPDNAHYTLDLQLSSTVKGNSVTYAIKNAGKQSQTFAIPKLSTAMAREVPGVKVRSRWENAENKNEKVTYRAPADKTSDFAISIEGAVELAEQPVSMEILDSKGVVIAVAQVVVHLPVLKQ